MKDVKCGGNVHRDGKFLGRVDNSWNPRVGNTEAEGLQQLKGTLNYTPKKQKEQQQK